MDTYINLQGLDYKNEKYTTKRHEKNDDDVFITPKASKAGMHINNNSENYYRGYHYNHQRNVDVVMTLETYTQRQILNKISLLIMIDVLQQHNHYLNYYLHY